jgi:hypothetical protein
MFPIQFGHRVQRFGVGLFSTFGACTKTDGSRWMTYADNLVLPIVIGT